MKTAVWEAQTKLSSAVDAQEEMRASSYEGMTWETSPLLESLAEIFTNCLKLQVTLEVTRLVLWPHFHKAADVFDVFCRAFWISKKKVSRKNAFTFLGSKWGCKGLCKLILTETLIQGDQILLYPTAWVFLGIDTLRFIVHFLLYIRGELTCAKGSARLIRFAY